jgi:uncharacterized phage-associated protein
MKALKLSEFIIAKFDESGDLLTNKKLQKLLYYIEAWSLVHLDSIIDEDFEAWIHGPVIPSVYHEYKKFSYAPILNNYLIGKNASDFIVEFEESNKNFHKYFELIDNVLNKYGILSSRELELLSHNEKPWIKARGNAGVVDNSNTIISKSDMKSFYSSLIS